jgi:hypothetical protein
MLKKPLSWNVKQVCTMINKGTIIFDNPLQRSPGQWDDESKSYLIHSLFEFFMPDIIALQVKQEKGNTYDILDGKQRLTRIKDFIDDNWRLTEIPVITLESTNEEYNISGLIFSELPEDVQNELIGYTVTFKAIELDSNDDEEEIVREIFRRWNKGVKVSGEHLAFVSTQKHVREFIHRIITEHKLFTDVAHYAPGAVKKSDKQMTVLQSIILVSGLDYNTFATKDVEKFFMNNNITDEVLNHTEQLFTVIADSFGNQYNKFCTKINITSMVGFLNSLDNLEQTKNFITWYSKNAKSNDEYKQYTGAGSTKKEKVTGRVKGLKTIFDGWKYDNFALTA